jgi:hypothetical protein
VIAGQALLSSVFGLATLATTLNANGLLLLQPDHLDLSPTAVLSALPGTLLFGLILGERRWPAHMPPGWVLKGSLFLDIECLAHWNVWHVGT